MNIISFRSNVFMANYLNNETSNVEILYYRFITISKERVLKWSSYFCKYIILIVSIMKLFHFFGCKWELAIAHCNNFHKPICTHTCIERFIHNILLAIILMCTQTSCRHIPIHNSFGLLCYEKVSIIDIQKRKYGLFICDWINQSWLAK